jgi:hypothetical protein
VQVVCCKLTPLQQKLYQTICQSKDIVRICKTGKGTKMVTGTLLITLPAEQREAIGNRGSE